jgi:FAD/FMN-containing dehydrogenase
VNDSDFEPASGRDLGELLGDLLGAERVYTGERAAAFDPGVDPDNLAAALVVMPADTAELARLLRYCNANRLAVVPQGGRTGLCGGATSKPGDVIVMLDRFDAIEDFDAESGVVVVGAGVRLEVLDGQLREQGWSVGVDLGARGSATIGGMVSTNAGGNEAFRNGVMRQRVLGLEAVMADGSLFSDLGRVTKNNDGYDIKQLLIGSEGTLGVVTRAALRLEAVAPAPIAALCACADARAAIGFLQRLLRDPRVRLMSAEGMWRDYVEVTAEALELRPLVDFAAGNLYLLVEIAQPGASADADLFGQLLAEAAERGEIDDALIAKNEDERRSFWRLREDWAIDRLYPHGLAYDVSVPRASLDDYVARLRQNLASIGPEFHVFIFGHLGDGNLHILVTSGRPHDDAIRAAVDGVVFEGLKQTGGAISAEHGIGLERRDALPKYICPTKYALMQSIKRLFDPHNILNPGKSVRV